MTTDDQPTPAAPPTKPTVAVSCDNEFDASVIASLLNDRGIDAEVVGGHIAGAGVFAPNPRIDVCVDTADYDTAIEILHSFETDMLPGEIAVDKHGHCAVCSYDMRGIEKEHRCPECGTDLHSLAERLRNRRFTIAAPPGDRNAPGSVGRFLIWLVAILFVLVPALIGVIYVIRAML